MPTAEDRERNMEAALSATISCFETVGVSNCTRELIAEKAGLSTRSLQRYFGTLNNLIRRATQQYMKTFNEQYEKLFHSYSVDGLTTKQQLEFALRMHVYLFQPDMPSVTVMQELEAYWKRQGEVPYELFAPRLEIQRHGYTKRRYGFIRDLLERGIEDGSFRSDLDLNLTHTWISVSFSGMLFRIAANPESYDHSENGISVKRVINAYVEAVLTAINA
ncbi:TetR/AcrR family transcriptional regulator [Ruminococcus sp. OA3]|uniref:TetR/AcrR family transcriptional regulator n=1 Tax=Ruminococcus sp. OA3 TaxID=2914164 RepID=UPI001F05716C|nr:TetR/AcrR family transcriptional regulator [Ruminococcus sp. OA3]MCH1983497.1 TetR/AcrR family transcriptional regulator [Ruminococcus sp. OA3]